MYIPTYFSILTYSDCVWNTPVFQIVVSYEPIASPGRPLQVIATFAISLPGDIENRPVPSVALKSGTAERCVTESHFVVAYMLVDIPTATRWSP
jgi:hypothetical protein